MTARHLIPYAGNERQPNRIPLPPRRYPTSAAIAKMMRESGLNTYEIARWFDVPEYVIWNLWGRSP